MHADFVNPRSDHHTWRKWIVIRRQRENPAASTNLSNPDARSKDERAETTGPVAAFVPVHQETGDAPMADDSTTTIQATFETRVAADLAVEHLVQQDGISRPDIFIQSAGDQNTAGLKPSDGDVSHEGGARYDAVLGGEIEVSGDIAASQLATVQRSLGDAGAILASGR
jgi:hypothetical protein